jgi:hypothetical protein
VHLGELTIVPSELVELRVSLEGASSPVHFFAVDLHQ